MDITYLTVTDLYSMSITKLRDIAAFFGIDSPTTKKKHELVKLIHFTMCGGCANAQKTGRGRPTSPPKNDYYFDWEKAKEFNSNQEFDTTNLSSKTTVNEDDNGYVFDRPEDDGEEFCGVLDIMQDGYGFVRVNKYELSASDVYVGSKTIRKFGLRRGDYLRVIAKQQFEGKPAAVINVITVNGEHTSKIINRPNFDDLVPVYPDRKYGLSNGKKSNVSMRIVDLVCPIGAGQRALIVAPPKAGKTTVIKNIANSININYPDVVLYVLLIDERPEEVTDMQRSINGEVVFSTFDDTPEHHIKVSEIVIDRAKRDVEMGKDVVVVMDSLTRLARAYNVVTESSGKTLSGGIDPQALQPAKKFFGSARNIEDGGSLTIIATALVDTGSRMDDVIYEEFKGTGNMEMHLSRRLSELRVFPAIDISKSGTRREDLLLSNKELEASFALRRMLSRNEGEATYDFLRMVLATKNNAELCEQILINAKNIEK